jgi:hypothetical protein
MHILKEWGRKFNSSPHCHHQNQHDQIHFCHCLHQTCLAIPQSTPTPASIHGQITSSRGIDRLIHTVFVGRIIMSDSRGCSILVRRCSTVLLRREETKMTSEDALLGLHTSNSTSPLRTSSTGNYLIRRLRRVTSAE